MMTDVMSYFSGKRLSKALAMTGLAMIVLPLIANQIGLSHNPGFGWKKLMFLLTGFPLAMFGTWTLSSNRVRDKLLPSVLAYMGFAAIGIGLAAHRLRIGHNPELRWTKALLFISGLGLIFLAGKLFNHHRETDEIVRTTLVYLGVVTILVSVAVPQLGLAQDPEFRWKRLALFVFGMCALGVRAEFHQLRRVLHAIPVRWWNRLALVLLPSGIFILNPNWPFQGLGHMDPWYYFGAFIHFPHYQRLSAGYPGERLMWILPGFLLAHLLSPVYGLLALHFVFFWMSVGSMYYAVNRITDSQTALVTSCLLGCHPLFIGANGWSYLDGACIGYFLLTFAFIVKAVSSRSSGLYLIFAGASWASLVYTYILWFALTPCCVFLYYALSPRDRRESLIKALRSLACFVAFFSVGAIILTLCLQAIHMLLYGEGRGFFFYNNIATAFYHLTLDKSPWSSNNFDWIPKASWIVFPVLVFFLSMGLVLQSWRGATKLTTPEKASVAIYLYSFLLLVVMTLRPNHLLEFDYFASMLIPPAFFVLGLTVLKIPEALRGSEFYIFLALACGVCLAPLWKVNFYRVGLVHGLAFPYLVGLAAVVIGVMAPKQNSNWLLILCFLSFASFPLVPAYPGLAWRAQYDGLASNRRIASAIKLIESRLPLDAYPAFWINNVNGKFTAEYRAIMCGFQSHGLSMYEYPQIDKDRTYKPGTFLILITEDRGVFESANYTMSQAGMPLVLYGQDRIATAKDGVSYWITYAKVQSNERALSGK
jgi:hypothetical protein